jgi:hypothetical protein
VPASCAGSRACQSCSRPRAGRSSNRVSCSVGQAWRVTDGARPAPFGATIPICRCRRVSPSTGRSCKSRNIVVGKVRRVPSCIVWVRVNVRVKVAPITILNSSGSRTYISRDPHGLSVGSSIISTPATSSSCPSASRSRTCNHRPTLSLAPVGEEPDSSRKPPPRKKNHTPGGSAAPLAIDVQTEALSVEPKRALEVGGTH